MKKEVVIIINEDDDGHALLIKKNLQRAGIINEILHFRDGKQTIDFLFCQGSGPHRESGVPYLLLLDIKMPIVDGIEVLKKIKSDTELKKMPVIVITTTDDPREVELCHKLGCNNYITKPIDYEKFVESIKRLGLFLAVVQVPNINGESQ